MHSRNKILAAGFLTALSVMLGLIDDLLISFFPMFPFIRTGLSNVALLSGIFLLPVRLSFCVAAGKVMITALFRGFSGPGFLLSLCGTVAGYCFMLSSSRFRVSMVTVSLCGALGHSSGQILVMFLFSINPAVLSMIPIFLFTSALSGILVASVSSLLYRRLKNLMHIDTECF